MTYDKVAEFFDELKNNYGNIIIYGAGIDGRLIAEVASNYGCPISYIADQNPLLHGLSICGISIVSKHKSLSKADAVLISTRSSVFEEEIISEINEYYAGSDQPRIIKRTDIPFRNEDVFRQFVRNPIQKGGWFGNSSDMHNEPKNDEDDIFDNRVAEGNKARQRIKSAREEFLDIGRKKWSGKKLLIVLPVSSIGGGMKVVLNEAHQMANMCVDVTIFNLAKNRAGFEKNTMLQLPVIYGEELSDLVGMAHEYDAVCSTWYTSVKYCAALSESTRTVYYVQDYEPDFFEHGSKEYYEALNSYTIVKKNVLVTKTQWNYDQVKLKTGAECTIIGPSVDLDLYRPGKRLSKPDRVILCAMIRPSTKRRSPQLTLDVLEHLSDKYGDRIEIFVFGSDPTRAYTDNIFWRQVSKTSQIINFGVLNSEEVASVLSSVDIFADLSESQAMGLTAMEAMACGCATVVPQNGGCLDFAENGRNALIINTHSKQACIDSISHLIDDEDIRKTISYNAIHDICEFYPEKAAYNFLNAVFPVE